MSGYNSRFLYDQCTFDQNLKQTTNPCRYQLLNDKFENVNMTIKNGPCQSKAAQKLNCSKCDTNSKANIEARWSSIGLRTDIESDLWAINRATSRCVDNKYHPCGPGCDGKKKYCEKKCPNHVVVNVKICERDIVPSQNKMPTSNGF